MNLKTYYINTGTNDLDAEDNWPQNMFVIIIESTSHEAAARTYANSIYLKDRRWKENSPIEIQIKDTENVIKTIHLTYWMTPVFLVSVVR